VPAAEGRGPHGSNLERFLPPPRTPAVIDPGVHFL